MRLIDGGVEAAGPPVRIARVVYLAHLRLLGRTPAPLVLVLAGLVVPLTVLRGGEDLRGAVLAAGAIGVSVLAFSVETPAEVSGRAAPVSRLRRRGQRVVLLVVGLALVAAVVVVVAGSARVPLDGWSRWIPAWVAIGSLALAGAGWSAGRDLGDPGMTGAVGSILVVLTATALAPRFAWLPNLLGDPARWWWVAAPAAAGAAWWWRDPAARRGRRFRPFPPDGRGGEDVGGPLGSGARDGGPLSPS